MNKNFIFQELIKNQRKNLSNDRKLSLSDLNRVSSYLTNSIFTTDCSIWNGYITEIKNNTHFINFFYNGKKQALHRLLFYNYVDDVSDNEYLKYSCENKGKCCCVSHIVKLKKKNDSKNTNTNVNTNTETETENNNDKKDDDSKNDDPENNEKTKITIEF